MKVASNSITVSNVNDGTIVHIAYADSADGTDGFYVGGGTNLLRNSAKLPFLGNSASSWSTGQWRVAGLTSNTHDMKRTSKEITDPPQGDVATVISYTGILRSSINDISLVAINSIPLYGNVTVSFWARQTSSVDTAFVSAHWSDSEIVNTNASTEKWNGTVYRKLFLPKDGSWTRFWGTSNVNNNENLYIGAGNTGTSAEVQICLVKIETGTTATPWSPAPSEAHPSYMGTYTDFTQADSLDPTKYAWSKIKGDDGLPAYVHYAYAWSADGSDRFTTVYPGENLLLIGKKPGEKLRITTTNAYYVDFKTGIKIEPDTTYTFQWQAENVSGNADLLISIGYANQYGLFTKDSINVRISAGTMTMKSDSVLAENGTYLGIRLNRSPTTSQSSVYDYWNLKIEKGDTATIYTPAPLEDPSNAYPSYMGTYTDYTAADSTDPTKYAWSKIKGDTGPKGDDGLPAYVHNAWSWSADGTDRFTTVYPNLNLLDGSKDFSGNWLNLDSNKWADDGTYKGLTVKKRTGQWQGVYKSFTAPVNGTFTFSAYVKGAGTGTTIDRIVFINGVENKTLEKIWTSAFDWTRDSITSNLNANDVIFVRYEIAVVGTNSILWTAGHKWEQGSTATPWMPSASEVKTSDYPSYMGTCSNHSETAPTDPSEYHWQADPTYLEHSKVNGDDFDNATNTIYEALEDKANSSELNELNHMATQLDNDYKAFIGEGGKYSSDLGALENRATELYKELGEKILGLTFINTWFKVGEEGLVIGTDGSNIKMLLSNDALSFVDGGQTVAYFTQQSFYINRGAVVQSLQVGSHAMISIGAEDTVIQFIGGATA